MYVTRRLSRYQREPTALSMALPEGPNSGILVIQDEEAQPTCFFGLCKSNQVKDLPFPQNYNLKVEYANYNGQAVYMSIDRVIFIPVLNQPLSSNQYYCINRSGKHKGEAYKSSTEEEMKTCCFFKHITDSKPETCDPHDIHQQFEIRKKRSYGYAAKSVTPGGFPPYFLRREGWTVTFSKPTPNHLFLLNEVDGLDKALRARLPNTYFPLFEKSSQAVVVGKWYCPFIFIKDGTLEDQMDSSRFYEMTLEQRWEQIFSCWNDKNSNVVDVEVVVETEAVEVFGKAAVNGGTKEDGVHWFKGVNKMGVTENDVGLSSVVVERMKWEESRFGWTGEREVRVKRVEEYGGKGNGWKKFGCYVLVERFVLKRMYGSLVLTYDFKHPQHIITKWE